MAERLITIHWNAGHGHMTVLANEFFPLGAEKMKKFERLVLRIADRKEEVQNVLTYLKEEALPYWTGRAKDKTDYTARLKLGQVKSNIKTVEGVLAKRIF